jgi:hypothetical protein
VSSGACSIVTFDQSASNSSAMIIGSMVLTPWPTSGFFAMIVIEPSGVMRMNALGWKSAAVFGAPARRALALATGSMYVARRTPPPASALTRRN